MPGQLQLLIFQEEEEDSWIDEVPEQQRAIVMARFMGTKMEPDLTGFSEISAQTGLTSVAWLFGGENQWVPDKHRMT